MENSSVANQESTSNKGAKSSPVGVPYPLETLETVIRAAEQLVNEHGTGKPITKEEIAKAFNRAPSAISLVASTIVQYGVFVTVHGKGYAPTELFRKYLNPVHDGDERKHLIEMFKKPPLYVKLIEQQNGHVLPTDVRRFGNMLKEEPYNVTDYATEKAARIFWENARNLGLLDSHNTFRIDAVPTSVKLQQPPSVDSLKDEQKGKQNQKHDDSDLFELPIPLSGNRTAKLLYPLSNLTKRDIRVIAKALAYIASTVLDEKEADEAEVDIHKEVFGS